MRKRFVFVFSMFLLFISLTQPKTTYANSDFFEGYRQGAAIRQQIERAREQRRILNGDQTQDIFIDKNFNFSKIHRMVFLVRIANGAEQYIDDPYIARSYTDILEEAFQGKDIFIESAEKGNQKLMAQYPSWSSMSDKMKTEAFVKFINENYQASLTVTIGSYSQNGESNVAVQYTVKDLTSGKDVFNDSDYRLHVLNKSKRKLLDIMTSKFTNEFFKAVDHPKKVS